MSTKCNDKMQALEKKELKLRQEKELLDIQTEMEMNDIVLEMEGSSACSEDSLELSLPEEEKYDAVKKWLKIDPQGVHNHKSEQQQPTFQVGLGVHADTQEGLPQLMSQVDLSSQQLMPQESLPQLTPQGSLESRQQLMSQVGPPQLTPQVGLQQPQVGLAQLMPQAGPQQLTSQVGPEQLTPQVGPQQLTPQVGPQQLMQQEGLQQLTSQVGLHQLTSQVGLQQLTLQVGPEQITSQVGPQQPKPQVGPQQLVQQEGLQQPQVGPAQLMPQAGPLQLIQQESLQQPQVGPAQLMPQAGPQQLTSQVGLQQLMSHVGPQQLMPQVGPQHEDAQVVQLVREQGNLTRLLLEQHTRSLLPQRSIMAFGGDPLQYVSFTRAFEHEIERKLSNETDKLFYLDQYTINEPNKLVKSCFHKPDGYSKAKEMLKKKYGDRYQIAEAYVTKAVEWPVVKADDASALSSLSLFPIECCNVLNDLNYISELDNTQNIKTILLKLPFRLRDRWRIKVDQIMEGGGIVKFNHLVDFIEKQSRIVSNPVYGDVVSPRDNVHKKHVNKGSKESSTGRRNRSLATKVVSPSHDKNKSQHKVQDNKERSCAYCDGKNHDLTACWKLQEKENKYKIEFLKSKGFCFGCLKKGSHISKNCTKRLTCKKCNLNHPTILHRDQNPGGKKSTEDTEIRSAGSRCSPLDGAGAPAMVPVKVYSRQTGRTILTYAFLDDGSNAVFCSERLRTQLGVSGKKTKLQVQTLLEDQRVNTRVLTDLEISDVDGQHTIQLPKVYTQDKMPVSLEDVVAKQDIEQWSYLSHISLQDYKKESCEVGLLIGSNVPKAAEPWEVIHSQNEGPYAYKTVLGWVVCGLKGKRTNITSNRILVKEDLHQQLVNMYNHDFNERTVDDKPEKSVGDQRFLEIASSTIEHNNGHYEIGLPLKDRNMKMPNNRARAEERAVRLRQKLKKNPAFHEEYKDFMEDMINNDYAEEVPSEDTSSEGCKWYIPHHGVHHPQKQKLRVVFDCSARYSGTSLNEQLLQGPDLTSTLTGVLTRFRQDSVALMADIKAMFYQVRVPKCDRDYLRFLWWPQGDIQKPMKEYRMNVHLFGATSSPSCSNFVLRETAKEAESRYDKQVTDALYQNFYVDDCLISVATEQEAIKLAGDLRSICTEGGFKLTKWMSNNRAVIHSIPESDRSKEMAEVDMDKEDLPNERVLGMLWSPERDQFGFQIAIKDRPPTRRGILSSVSSVYDPLGFVGPVVLTAKQILQDLCRQRYDWDDQIPHVHLTRWQERLRDLPMLSEFGVERCLKPKNYGNPDRVHIHHFCDASEAGYGVVSYMRMKNDKGIHCSFLTSKARVAPIKQVTIPRLELTAATIAVKVNNMLAKELQLKVDEVHYWTDSMSVLQYIRNENFLQCERWLKGPSFLWKEESEWPDVKIQKSSEYLSTDPEVKVATSIVREEKDNPGGEDSVDKLLNYFSSWHDLKKAVGWILRVRENLHQKASAKKQDKVDGTKTEGKITNHLSVEELQEAEKVIIKYVQQKAFPEEVKLLSNVPKEEERSDHHVKRSSPIYRLDPTMTDGVLRVGGRLSKAAMPEESKHPAILPKNQHVTNLILKHIHDSSGHSGRNHMLSEAQKKYWIIQANSSARRVINKCVVCRRQRAKRAEQKMANLPKARVTPEEAPFTRVGMDYFGPIEVKQGRSMIKRYGVVFTCLAIRAVHIEKADNLDTDSCINAIRRFQARRGQVKQIVSDNGTNLVGAEKELRKDIDKRNQSRIHESMLQRNIEWVFNPPSASHFGGIWERQIRTIRKVMVSILKEQTLTDESLQTLFCEVESVINNRPITRVPGEPGDLEALTPNHLLLLKVKPILPPVLAEETGPYVKRRWKQIQYMADIFWKRWSKEYVAQLQERQKWALPKPNVKVGDIVLVANDAVPRNQWKMGRVTVTIPDQEGYVRQVKLQTKTSELVRPVHKLVLLLEADNFIRDLQIY